MPCVANIQTWQEGVRARLGFLVLTPRHDSNVRSVYATLVHNGDWCERYVREGEYVISRPSPDHVEPARRVDWEEEYTRAAYNWNIEWFRTEDEACDRLRRYWDGV